jgi:hypothetical protein
MLLTTEGLHESLKKAWPTAWMVFVDWPVTPVRLWDGLGNLKYGGETFVGIRQMGRILGVGGSKAVKVREVTLELKGVGNDVSEFLGPVIRNRIARGWLAGLDRNGARVNGEPELVVEGRADQREVFVDEQRRTGIRLKISEPSYLVERAQNLLWTPEWIKRTYGDSITGLDQLSRIENERIPWTQT